MLDQYFIPGINPTCSLYIMFMLLDSLATILLRIFKIYIYIGLIWSLLSL